MAVSRQTRSFIPAAVGTAFLTALLLAGGQAADKDKPAGPKTVPASAPATMPGDSVRAALDLLAGQKVEQAREMLERLGPLHESDAIYRLVAGCADAKAGKYDRAIESLSRAAELRSDLAEARLQLGVAYILAKKPNDATAAFLAGRRLAADDARFAYAMGVFQVGAQLYDAAERSLSEVQQAGGPFAEAAQELKAALSKALDQRAVAAEPIKAQLQDIETDLTQIENDLTEAGKNRQETIQQARAAEATEQKNYDNEVSEAHRQFSHETRFLNPDNSSHASRIRDAEKRRDRRISAAKDALQRAIASLREKYGAMLGLIDSQAATLQRRAQDLIKQRNNATLKLAMAMKAPPNARGALPPPLEYAKEFERILDSAWQHIADLMNQPASAPASQPAASQPSEPGGESRNPKGNL